MTALSLPRNAVTDLSPINIYPAMAISVGRDGSFYAGFHVQFDGQNAPYAT